MLSERSVNCSQSTNDVFRPRSASRQYLFFEQDLIALEELKNAFKRKVRSFKLVLKSSRTRLMAGVPIRMSQEFAAYSEAMRRCSPYLTQAQQLLKDVGLGDSPVGTGISAHPGYQKLVVRYLRYFRLRTQAWEKITLRHAVQPPDELGLVGSSEFFPGVDTNQKRFGAPVPWIE